MTVAEKKIEAAEFAFSWDDPFLIEDQLTEEERMIRDTAAAFAADKLAPRVTRAYAEEREEPEIFREMGASGLLGVTIPEEYGGVGAGYVSYGLVAREVERIDSGYRSMMSVQSSLVMYPIHAYGSEEQRRKYLPGLASGDLIGCFGLTEPDAGSDPGRHEDPRGRRSTAATGSDGRQDVDLEQRPSPMCSWSGRSPKHTATRSSGFVLERGMPGLSAPKIEGKLSLRASTTGEIVMDNVEVSDAALLPNVSGLRGPFGCLNRARYGISWGTMGAAEACWHAARQYGLERQQFGKPLAQTQLFQKKLADMQTEIALGLQGALRIGRLMRRANGPPR